MAIQTLCVGFGYPRNSFFNNPIVTNINWHD